MEVNSRSRALGLGINGTLEEYFTSADERLPLWNFTPWKFERSNHRRRLCSSRQEVELDVPGR